MATIRMISGEAVEARKLGVWDHMHIYGCGPTGQGRLVVCNEDGDQDPSVSRDELEIIRDRLDSRTMRTRHGRVMVDAGGVVRLWDEISGHYTTCHSLSEQVQRTIVADWRSREAAGTLDIGALGDE